jgi:cytidine deaminase
MRSELVELIERACSARLVSYSPYSRFRVGAALRARGGRIYTGANVECVSIGLSICAERAALARAVVAGERRFEALAICADGKPPTPPCGACRQLLREFGPELEIVMAGELGAAGEVWTRRLDELLPDAFVPRFEETSPPKGRADAAPSAQPAPRDQRPDGKPDGESS